MPTLPPNEQGYFNTHSPSQNYFEIRQLAGKVRQSREYNEEQAIARDLSRRLGNAFFRDGAVISGGGYTLSPGGATIEMEETEFYFDGIVHLVPAASLAFTTGATQTFGLKATYSIVTFNEDQTLRDPATVPGLNFGKPGANRLKIECAWTRNDVEAVTVYTFDAAGIQQTVPTIGVIDPVEKTLAQRTYDESGNYIVNGFNVDAQDKDEDNFLIRVGNRAGLGQQGSTAYIRGVRFTQIVPKEIVTSKALDSSDKSDNGFYAPTDPDAPTADELRFALVKPVAKELTRVRARFARMRIVTNHQGNGIDQIAEAGESLVEVLQVYSNTLPKDGDDIPDADTVYLKAPNAGGPGAYYVAGDSINWNVGSPAIPTWSGATAYGTGDVVSYLGVNYQAKAANVNQTPSGAPNFWRAVVTTEPTPGGSYYVYYTADRDLNLGTEADLVTIDGASYLDISGLAIRPYAENLVTGQVVSSPFLVDYSYYLARIDVVYMNLALGAQEQQTVEILVQPGTSAENPSPPQVPGGALPIAQVFVRPGLWAPGTTPQENVSVTEYNVKRVTMLEIQAAFRRLERAEYNIAVKDLETEAVNRAASEVTGLNGIFTEPFRYTANDIQTRTVRFNDFLTTPGIFSINKRCMTLPLTSTVVKLKTSASPAPAFYGLDEVSSEFPSDYVQDVRTSTIRVNQFDQAPPDAEIIVGTGNNSNFPVENSGAALGVVNPKSAALWAQGFRVDYAKAAQASADAASASNSTAPRTSAPGSADAFADVTIQDFFKRTWHWIYGTGFPANALIELRMDGRAPYLNTTAPVGAWPHPSITEPTGSALVTFAGAAAPVTPITVDGVTYPNSVAGNNFVRTDSLGRFRCAFLVPEGVAAGEVLVSATSITQEHRMAVSTIKAAGSTVKVVDATPTVIFETLRAVADSVSTVSVPPVVKEIRVYLADPTTGATAVNNLTVASNIWVRVFFEAGNLGTVKAGTPQAMTLLVKRDAVGADYSITKDRLVSSTGWDLSAGYVDFSPTDLFKIGTTAGTLAALANITGSSFVAIAANGNAFSSGKISDPLKSGGNYKLLSFNSVNPTFLQPKLISFTPREIRERGVIAVDITFDDAGVAGASFEVTRTIDGQSTVF